MPAYGNRYRKRSAELPEDLDKYIYRPDPPPFDRSRIPMEQRLKFADDFVAAHPGRPISAMLMDLFPELPR